MDNLKIIVYDVKKWRRDYTAVASGYEWHELQYDEDSYVTHEVYKLTDERVEEMKDNSEPDDLHPGYAIAREHGSVVVVEPGEGGEEDYFAPGDPNIPTMKELYIRSYERRGGVFVKSFFAGPEDWVAAHGMTAAQLIEHPEQVCKRYRIRVTPPEEGEVLTKEDYRYALAHAAAEDELPLELAELFYQSDKYPLRWKGPGRYSVIF